MRIGVGRRLLSFVVSSGAFLLAAVSTAHAAGEEIALPPPAHGDAWSELGFRSVERSTSYTPVTLDGLEAVRADADCSASALVLPIEEIDLARTPLLRWRWRLERGIDVENEREKSGDDFAARVYVMFSFERERASWLERMRHRAGTALLGREPPGSALNFVWSQRQPVGASWTSPYTDSSRMLAVESGAATGWREERVDVPARFRALFGAEPPQPIGLALMSDADDSCQRASAYFADFGFLSRSP